MLVRPGRDARLLDISDGGALIEIETPLRPGGPIHVQLSMCDARVGIRGRVVRCYVAFLRADCVRYHGAIAFESRLSSLHALGSGYSVPRLGRHATEDFGHALPRGRQG